jgi:nucleoside-diphosphate-sugar epimerase
MKKKLKLNPFNVRMLTMHRYFSLENAKKDLQFEPVVDQSEAWPSTIEWFKEYWLPKFKASQQSKKAK